MHAISEMRKSLAQKSRGIICFRDDCTRCVAKFIQSDFELPRRKNVVRVGGKTERDGKKLVDPKSGARSHAGEMRVHMIYPHLPQAPSNMDRLVKPKEIGAASPFIECGDNVCADLPFFCGVSNFFQQLLFLRNIMHALNDACVPILWWLVFRISDRKDWRRDVLAIKLCHFPIAKRLSERWESLEEVSETRHLSELL
jgi:hypothetical protein